MIIIFTLYFQGSNGCCSTNNRSCLELCNYLEFGDITAWLMFGRFIDGNFMVGGRKGCTTWVGVCCVGSMNVNVMCVAMGISKSKEIRLIYWWGRVFSIVLGL